MSEQISSEVTPVSTPANRDFTKWIVAALVVAVIGSEVVLLRQNRALKKRVAAAQTLSVDVKNLRMQTDRNAYQAALLGQCQPFGSGTATARPLDVSIYFSVDRDCGSCLAETVTVWNEALHTLPSTVTVRGYTEVDGTEAQKAVDALRVAFPLTVVPQFRRKLEAIGVTHTPVVVVSDVTGRILMTHAAVTWEKNDRQFVERVRAAATACK
ncbi:MAG TPA: hypothetical protein VF618_25710 [Thermoanaerobaculia bacterium]